MNQEDFFCKIDDGFSFSEVKSAARVRSFGEVFTPLKFVNQMLDMLPATYFTNAGVIFVEPSCGDGAFLTGVLDRRFHALAGRSGRKQAIRQALVVALCSTWGIDIQKDNVGECRANVLRFVLSRLFTNGATPNSISTEKYFLSVAIAIIHHHIICCDGLSFDPGNVVSFVALPPSTQRSVISASGCAIDKLLRGNHQTGRFAWMESVIRPHGSVINS